MSQVKKLVRVCIMMLVLALFMPAPLYAQGVNGVSQIETFIKSIVQLLAGLSGLVATGFFVVGGYGYITSSGHPQRLEKAKRTLLYAAIGLAITIAAFVLSNIVADLARRAFGS